MSMRHVTILTAVICGVWMAFPPSLLHADRCGTWTALAHQPNGTAADRPTDTPLNVVSPHFRVHYASPALAAYASEILTAAERAYSVLIDTLGYRVPPSDGANGGDSRTDCYVQSPGGFGGAWGRTLAEDVTGVPFSNSSTSWVEVVDTLSPGRLQRQSRPGRFFTPGRLPHARFRFLSEG